MNGHVEKVMRRCATVGSVASGMLFFALVAFSARAETVTYTNTSGMPTTWTLLAEGLSDISAIEGIGECYIDGSITSGKGFRPARNLKYDYENDTMTFQVITDDPDFCKGVKTSLKVEDGNLYGKKEFARYRRTKLADDPDADLDVGNWSSGGYYLTSIEISIRRGDRKITTIGSPAQYGSPTPGYGSLIVTNDDPVAFSLPGSGSAFYDEAGTMRGIFRSVVRQFEGESPVTNTAASFSLSVMTNLFVTWNFNTEYRHVAVAREGGAVSGGGQSGAAVTNWMTAGSSLVLTATPDSGYRLVAWGGDVPDGADVHASTQVLPADRPRMVVAIFAAINDYTTVDYVQDGLVLHLDGINNTGIGIHVDDAAVWADLSGNGHHAARVDGLTIPWENGNAMRRGSNTLRDVVQVTNLTLNLDSAFTFDFCGVQDEKYIAYLLYFAPAGKTAAYLQVNANYRAYVSGANVQFESANSFYTGRSLVGCRDGMRNVLYDGSSQKTVTGERAVGTQGDGTGALSIASGPPGTYVPYKGLVRGVRIYNRALTDKEIRWNTALDSIRFDGASAEGGEVVISALPQALAAPSPGYGTQILGVATNNVFTMGGLVTDGYDGARIAVETAGTNVRYVYTGYTFTNGVVNPVVVSGEEESVTNGNLSLFNDLVWKFRKEYRTIVTSQTGGAVTVAGVTGSCVTNFTDSVTLTIRAMADTAAGYSFFKWSGDITDIADPTQPEIVVPVKGRNLVAMYTWEEPGHVPVTTAWDPSIASGDWSDPANWDNGVPQKGDTVIISNVAANTTLTIPVPTAELALLAVGNTNGKTTTLVQDGWFVSICAETIDLGQGVTVTCADACTYGGDLQRVHLRGTNLYLRAGAKIDVTGKGYKKGTGPCWAKASSSMGYHGGAYGGVADNVPHVAYGSAEFPVDPGSGGNQNSATSGGGAVRLDFAGAIVIDGDVTANGGYDKNYGQTYASGSGGGIWITCRTIAGAGQVLANARSPWEDDFSHYRLSGGGGRIAVHYDTTAQNAVSCGIRFEARGGMSRAILRGTKYTDTVNIIADYDKREPTAGAGTIWFSDNRFLTAEPYVTDGWKFAGVWCSPTPVTSLNFEGDLLLDASYVVFSAPSFALTVGGKLQAKGIGFSAQRENGLVLSNGTVNIAGDLELDGARLELSNGGSIAVGGDATLSGYTYYDAYGKKNRNLSTFELGGGEISVQAAPTAEMGMAGAVVTVGGTLHLAAKSVVKPYCDPDTGSIVAFRVKNLTMDADTYFDATMKGFGDWRGPGTALSTANAKFVGASHGGKGGVKADHEDDVAETYGNRRRPLLPGSGAGSSTTWHGFRGGGVVYVTASDSMTLNGLVTADGNRNFTVRQSANYCPGSSGGSVYLVMRKLRPSTGSISALGGVAYTPNYPECTGGGGRIAIWYGQNRFATPADFAAFTSNVSAAAGVAMNSSGVLTDETHSEDGTVYWGRLSGAIILVK